jgi:16S rRNA (cytosine967-C5)-methyltransferase
MERGFITELVYGVVRRQRTLDVLVEQLSQRAIQKQAPDLRRMLHLGLYQLRYLGHLPPAAVVHSTVELAKTKGLGKLSGVVNGILRQYLRQQDQGTDPLQLPANPSQRLGLLHSFPDWIIDIFLAQWGEETTTAICHYLNQTPSITLRTNPLQGSRATVIQALEAAGVATAILEDLPQGLRLIKGAGAITALPGFTEGWWTVQDASAQMVALILAPQAGETIIDACAAPGGKTTHIAELMQDQGRIYALDQTASRLKKLVATQQRLGLTSIQTWVGDSRQFSLPPGEQADRVLVDAPCSGLGTLNHNPDIRWRQAPEKIQQLIPQQQALLARAATWVKSGGCLVYATCTLNASENQAIVQDFLAQHPTWQLEPIIWPDPANNWADPAGWLQILPHQHQRDGFFIAKLRGPV